MARKKVIEEKKEEANKKPRRFRPSVIADRKIRKEQKGVKLILARRPFQDLCRDIVASLRQDKPCGFESDVFRILQHRAEDRIHKLLKNGHEICEHGKRMTLSPGDMKLGQKFRQ